MRKTLGAALSIAMLAALSVAGATTASAPADSVWFGKGEVPIYDSWSDGDCGEPLLDSGGPYGTLKINVKDGNVKVNVKFLDDSVAGQHWNVKLYQVKDWGWLVCDTKSEQTLGTFTADADGKGGFKDGTPYECGANLFWVELSSGSTAYYKSLAIWLEDSTGDCL